MKNIGEYTQLHDAFMYEEYKQLHDALMWNTIRYDTIQYMHSG
jgi:hypothetical protein